MMMLLHGGQPDFGELACGDYWKEVHVDCIKSQPSRYGTQPLLCVVGVGKFAESILGGKCSGSGGFGQVLQSQMEKKLFIINLDIQMMKQKFATMNMRMMLENVSATTCPLAVVFAICLCHGFFHHVCRGAVSKTKAPSPHLGLTYFQGMLNA
jgi:hypothetical protein